MDAPWEFAPKSARTGNGRHRWRARSLSQTEVRLGAEVVRWGSTGDRMSHQACVLDAAGAVLGEREFKHGGAGLTEMATWLLSFTDGKATRSVWRSKRRAARSSRACWSATSPSTRSIRSMLDRFRDRLSPAGGEGDRRDARVLASALRTDPHCLRRLEPTDPAIVELPRVVAPGRGADARPRPLAHRMRQQLWRYYPQFHEALL